MQIKIVFYVFSIFFSFFRTTTKKNLNWTFFSLILGKYKYFFLVLSNFPKKDTPASCKKFYKMLLREYVPCFIF